MQRKTPVLDYFLNKPAGLQLYQKETPTHVFPVNITNFLRTPPVAASN